ncbi:Fur family transcriptional regulator [Acidobacteriota bacterium]
MPIPRARRHMRKGHFHRWTAPREAILQLLSGSSKHMSAKEVYAAIHRHDPGVGLTTVYRTLGLLHEMGLIHKFAAGDGHRRYEFAADETKEHHHHLICTNCGKIIDYSEFVDEELALVKKIEDKLSKKYNFEISDHNIEFLGLCPKCK